VVGGNLIALISAGASLAKSNPKVDSSDTGSTLTECPKCGNFNHESYERCAYCGKPLQEPKGELNAG